VGRVNEGGRVAFDASELSAEIPGLLRYAQTLTSDPDAAADLVQETVVRALAKSASFRGDSSLATWLHRILHNIAVDTHRRRKEFPMGDPITDLHDPEGLGDAVEAKWRDDAYTVDAVVVTERAETRRELEDALAHLPFIYRSAVLLHDVEQFTSAEVSSVQGIGLAAAKQRLRRGRMMLVTELAVGAERQQMLTGVPMRCWDARNLVSDYLDDELPPRERQLLERHLEVCPTCPPLYAGLVGATVNLGAMRDSDRVVAPELASRIEATISAAGG
jgi:RNA polymerase sigma-70 factor (ECF subfamily)